MGSGVTARIEVDVDLETPPYAQIAEQIRGAIARGDLPPGSLVPTVRQLAIDLAVAPNTVARAYAELQAEGWIAAEGRRGTRVAERVPAADLRARTADLRERVERFIAGLLGHGYTRAEIATELDRAAR